MISTRIKFRQLSAFIAVSELHNFTLAAQRMRLTPSAISNLIAELEATLGFALFERTTRKVTLTAAGRKFLPSAISVQRELDRASHLVTDIRGGATDVVRVAAPMTIASVILPDIIAKFRKRHSHTTVYVVDTGVEWLVDRVSTGEADFAVGPDRYVQSNVLRTNLYPSEWVAWCSPNHALAKYARLSWSHLEGTTVFTAGNDYEQNVVPHLTEHGEYLRAKSVHVVENFSTALGMAAAGLGITFSPDYVAPFARLLGLVMRPLRNPSIRRHVCLYEPSKNGLSLTATALRNFIVTNGLANAKVRRQ